MKPIIRVRKNSPKGSILFGVVQNMNELVVSFDDRRNIEPWELMDTTPFEEGLKNTIFEYIINDFEEGRERTSINTENGRGYTLLHYWYKSKIQDEDKPSGYKQSILMEIQIKKSSIGTEYTFWTDKNIAGIVNSFIEEFSD